MVSTAGVLSASTCDANTGVPTNPSCCMVAAVSAYLPASQLASPEAVQPMVDLSVESGLQWDSLANVSTNTHALVAATRDDKTKTFEFD